MEKRHRTKEWFEHRLLIFSKYLGGKGKKLTATKGYKPDVNQNKYQQRIDNIKAEAKKRGYNI